MKFVKKVLPFIFLTSFIFNSNLLFAKNKEIMIPLESQSWQVLKFNKIPANSIVFSANKMNIFVDKSSSPVIYTFKKIKRFKRLRVKGSVTGDINNLFLKEQQGSKGADDFVFKIGVVYEGEKTLGFWKRKFAADWILKLFSLAPQKSGISYVQFFNVYKDQNLKNKKRTHPLSDLLKEKFVTTLNKNNEFLIDEQLLNKKILALWVSADGDDTLSKFNVAISELSLY